MTVTIPSVALGLCLCALGVISVIMSITMFGIGLEAMKNWDGETVLSWGFALLLLAGGVALIVVAEPFFPTAARTNGEARP